MKLKTDEEIIAEFREKFKAEKAFTSHIEVAPAMNGKMKRFCIYQIKRDFIDAIESFILDLRHSDREYLMPPEIKIKDKEPWFSDDTMIAYKCGCRESRLESPEYWSEECDTHLTTIEKVTTTP